MTSVEFHGMCWPASVVDTRGQRGAEKHTASYIRRAAKQLPVMIEHCRGFNLVIQAGGHCGAWPAWLAGRFRWVVTWEPDPDNHACLLRNVPDNVVVFGPAVLGDDPAASYRWRHNGWNTGGHHAVPEAGSMPVDRIDDRDLAPDAIVLDVEGMELPALRGAAATIERCRPVIMIEDKGHGTTYGWGEALPWLRERGYQVVAKTGHDKVLVPAEPGP